MRELRLKEDRKTHGFYVDGLSMHTVSSYPRVKHLISVGALWGGLELAVECWAHSAQCRMHEAPDTPPAVGKEGGGLANLERLLGGGGGLVLARREAEGRSPH